MYGSGVTIGMVITLQSTHLILLAHSPVLHEFIIKATGEAMLGMVAPPPETENRLMGLHYVGAFDWPGLRSAHGA